jgi:hypothetical protein
MNNWLTTALRATAKNRRASCRAFGTIRKIGIMSFSKELTGYEKTILSDLQGAWAVLRESVVDAAGFDGWERAIF